MTDLRKKLVAEAFGTFTLVFIGTGAIVIDQVAGGAIGHLGVCIAFGLVVMAMIYAIGDVSGAHINPAVTLGFFAARRFPGSLVVPYIGAQLCGGILASVLLFLMFQERPASLGATMPANGVGTVQAFLLEVVLTWVLMLVILRVCVGARETGIMAGAAIGSVIAFEALVGGPISGASMNPARSLAPALVSGTFAGQWIYLSAPVLGALLAVPVCKLMQTEGCCGADVRPTKDEASTGSAST